jgi:hypothetical protein
LSSDSYCTHGGGKFLDALRRNDVVDARTSYLGAMVQEPSTEIKRSAMRYSLTRLNMGQARRVKEDPYLTVDELDCDIRRESGVPLSEHVTIVMIECTLIS